MINLKLFGYPTVWQDGEQVTGFISEKAMALLIFLAVSGKIHSRDYLIGLLWGDSADIKAKSSLRSALYNLKQLFPDLLDVNRKTAAIHADVSYKIDIDQLRQYSNPTPYTADFLAGFYISDAPEFEEWLLRKREQLRAQAIAIWQKTAVQATTDQEKYAAYDQWRKLEPWREEIYRQQMKLLCKTGDYTAALALYKSCVDTLAQELDLAPSLKTEQLADQIRVAQTIPRHNLPADTAPFFGRERLIKQVQDGLYTNRLVSLVGLGGSGKTSLAKMVGRQYASRFLHGVAFISLEQLSAASPNDIATAIVQTMVQAEMFQPSREADETYLLDQISKREMLLILDNMEHLIDQSGIIDQLLRHGPDLHILVTTRERLQHPQEQVFMMDGLDTTAAVALFTAVAQRVQSSFIPDQQIAKICQQVDGLPLAIELAASWVDIQTPAEIATDLQQSFDLLQDESHHRLARHQNISTIFEYAWHHLGYRLQQILLELTSFQGGFTAVAAKAIAQASPADLRTLKNRALIQGAEQRFDLHPLLKQFVQAKGTPQQDRSFAQYFLNYFASVGEKQSFAQIRTLPPDYENFAKAWHWATQHALEFLINPAGYLHILFADRGLDEWTNGLVETALNHLDGRHFPQLKIRLKLEKVYYLFWQAQKANDAQALLNEIIHLASDWRDWTTEQAYYHTLHGWIDHYHHKDLTLAEHHYQQAADIWHQRKNLNQLASRQLDLGNIAFRQGDHTAAAQHWIHCAQSAQAAKNDLAYACAEFSLARLAIVQNDLGQAQQQLALAKPYVQEHYGLHVEWLKLESIMHIGQNRFVEAKASMLQQIGVCQAYGRVAHTIKTYCNLGRLALLQANLHEADVYFSRAESLASKEQIAQLKNKIATYRKQPQFTVDDI